MKNLLVLAVLAVLALSVNGAVIGSVAIPEPVVVVENIADETSADAQSNINVGTISAGDRRLHWNNYYLAPVENVIREQEITYLPVFPTNTITAIQLNEVGQSQFPTASIVGGGVGSTWVRVRITTASGSGYHFSLAVWGR